MEITIYHFHFKNWFNSPFTKILLLPVFTLHLWFLFSCVVGGSPIFHIAIPLLCWWLQVFSFCLKFTCLKFWFWKFVTLKLCSCFSHSECSNTMCWDHYGFWFRSSCYEGCCKDFEYVWCALWGWLLMNYRVYFGIQELLII